MNSRDSPVRIGVVNPLQGPLGIIGPAADLCARMAADEINESGGLLGREVQLVSIDGGRAPAAVASTVSDLIVEDALDAVVGTHTSAVRRRLVRAIGGRIPYAYSSLYEGGESSPGVFVTGETARSQLIPAIDLLSHDWGIRQWCIVGNDYVWPRATAALVRSHLGSADSMPPPAHYAPVGTSDFSAILDRLERSSCDGVVVLLVGQDGIDFHRAFARRGLHHRILRITPLMDENMLLAVGEGACHRLYVSASYFANLATESSIDFVGRYSQRFGFDAPLVGTMAESCYEAIKLISELAHQAGHLNVPAMMKHSDSLILQGAKGEQRLRQAHTDSRMYLAEVDGLEFTVMTDIYSPAM